MMRFVQAISVYGKGLLRLLNTVYPVLPCPIMHVTTDRHLRGITRAGHKGWAPSKSTKLRLEQVGHSRLASEL